MPLEVINKELSRHESNSQQAIIMELSCEESCCSAGNNQAAQVLSPLLRPRLLQTERSFAARFWATRYQWRIPALVTASTFPSQCCRVPDVHEGPGEPFSRAPAALAPGSWTPRAAGVAVEVAAAPRGRPALNGRYASSPPPPTPPLKTASVPFLSLSAF